jgi:hypothetical protein
MAASIEKFFVGALVVLLMALILCPSFSIADQPKEIEKLLNVEMHHTESEIEKLFNADLHATESEDFKVGVPLYRVKDMPHVLIPASLIPSQSPDKPSPP